MRRVSLTVEGSADGEGRGGGRGGRGGRRGRRDRGRGAMIGAWSEASLSKGAEQGMELSARRLRARRARERKISSICELRLVEPLGPTGAYRVGSRGLDEACKGARLLQRRVTRLSFEMIWRFRSHMTRKMCEGQVGSWFREKSRMNSI